MADRLDRLSVVQDRYMEYVALWAKQKEAHKNAALEIYNEEVLPVQTLLDQMSDLVGKFADKFLGEFPTLTSPKPQPGLFDVEIEGRTAEEMTTAEFLESQFFSQFLKEPLEVQAKVIREAHFNRLEAVYNSDDSLDPLSPQMKEHIKIRKAFRKDPAEIGNEIFGAILMKTLKIKLPYQKEEPKE